MAGDHGKSLGAQLVMLLTVPIHQWVIGVFLINAAGTYLSVCVCRVSLYMMSHQ